MALFFYFYTAMPDRPYSNDDIKTLFIKFDRLDKRQGAIETHLFSETGYRPTPESPMNEGFVWKEIHSLKYDIHGNGNMGMKTKLFIVMWVFPFLFSVIGALGMKFIDHFFFKS